MDNKPISIKDILRQNKETRPLTQEEKDKKAQRELKKRQRDYKSQYTDKLRDPRWQKKRLEVFQRDDFKCRLCNDSETELHVHHLEYIKGREPWEYDVDWFETLCKYCHKFIEDFKEDGVNLIDPDKFTIFYKDDKINTLRVIETPKYIHFAEYKESHLMHYISFHKTGNPDYLGRVMKVLQMFDNIFGYGL
jgi:5-methylcytosine-specific restriction endonuclease McrA